MLNGTTINNPLQRYSYYSKAILLGVQVLVLDYLVAFVVCSLVVRRNWEVCYLLLSRRIDDVDSRADLADSMVEDASNGT